MITDLPILAWILRIIAGLVAGLVINYLADVLPEYRCFTQPVCQACRQPFPLKPYLLIQKCPECGQRKTFRFAGVLVSSILASILLTFFPFAGMNFWAALPILIFMGVIIVIDIEHHLVLYETSLVGMVMFLIYGILLRGFLATFLGGLGGFGIMLVFYLSGILFVKILGRLRNQKINEVAFGFGDVSAGTFLGLLTGWPAIIGAVIIAILVFGLYSLGLLFVLLLTKKYQAYTSALPFAPFLVIGVVVIYYL